MFQSFIKQFAYCSQKVENTLVAHLCAHHEGIDKHSDRLCRPYVSTAVADGGQRNTLIVAKACQGIEHSSQSQVCQRQLVFAAEALHALQVKRAAYICRLTLGYRIRQVGWHFCHLLAFAQLFFEESFRCSILRSVLSLLLINDKLCVCILFFLYSITFQGTAYLL